MDLKLRLGVFWSNNDHVGRVKDIPLLMVKRYASNILLQTDGLTVPEEFIKASIVTHSQDLGEIMKTVRNQTEEDSVSL